MESKKVTGTKGRLSEGLDKITSSAIENTVPTQIKDAVDLVKIRTGVITKFYPYIDKAEVRLDYNGKKILCKILHRCGGDLIEFYTPSADRTSYDSKLHEPYVVPKASQNVCVIHVHDDDSDENLILGYYQNKEIVGFNPAKPGNIKIMSVCEDKNEYWLKFGFGGFNYRVGKSPNRIVGDVHSEEGVSDVQYTKSDDVYTIDEIDELIESLSIGDYYTKGEVDEKLAVYEEKITHLEDILRENNLLED